MADAHALVEAAAARVLAEVPALANLKLVVGLDLRGRGDVQMYRLELPGPHARKDAAQDARVRIEIPRADFNELAEKGTVAAWRREFESGRAKASGVPEIIKLIANVVEKQQSRAGLRRARGS